MSAQPMISKDTSSDESLKEGGPVESSGSGEGSLRQLQGRWEVEMMNADMLMDPKDIPPVEKQSIDGAGINTVHDLNVPNEELESTAAAMFFPNSPLETPLPTPLPGSAENSMYSTPGNDVGSYSEAKRGRPSPYMMGEETRGCSGLANLSGLHDELLVNIISLLPIKEAVRTSALSKRWRYLYASSSNLDFSFKEIKTTKPADVMKTVGRLFCFRNKRPINRFTFECLEAFEPSLIEGWLQCVMWCGIREINITVPADLLLPPSLFACETLVKLHLDAFDNYNHLEVPTRVCLPSLKHLDLERVSLFSKNASSCERLISNCPVLESFFYAVEDDENAKLVVCSPTLKHLRISCYILEAVIDAPSLVCLEDYSCYLDSRKFINVQSLAEAKIQPEIDDDVPIHVACDLLRGIRNVQKLDIGATLIGLLKFNIPIPAFHNLTELIIPPLQTEFGFAEILYFLTCCANLETLIFKELPPNFNLDAQHTLEETRPQCLSFRLKTITISYYNGNQDEMKMVSYFLNSARVLESFSILQWSSVGGYENYSDERKKLLMLPRVSKQCNVDLDGRGRRRLF